MVLELKNIVGLIGNPLLQAIVDYGKIISQEKYKHFQEFCNFPIVLVGVAENRINISIAICVGEMFPQPTPVDPSVVFPVHNQFLTRAGQPTPVLAGLGDKRHTAMYIAALDGTENDVIVKFTARCNEMARRILASAGFAPKLHFCGRVVGGLYMIVWTGNPFGDSE